MALTKKNVDVLFKQESLLFFLELFLLTFAVDGYLWISRGHYAYSIYVAAHDFITCYLFTLSTLLVPFKYNRVYQNMLITIISLFSILDIFCLTEFETNFNGDIAAIILGTNFNETKEFLTTFISPSFIAFSCLCLIFIYAYNLFRCRTSYQSTYWGGGNNTLYINYFVFNLHLFKL